MPKRKITKTLMEDIAQRMSAGELLTDICKDDGMPTAHGVMVAAQRDDELWEIYRRGRAGQAEQWLEDLKHLASAPIPAEMDKQLANAEMQRRKIEIDAVKWAIARVQPYGLRSRKEDAPQDATVTITWGAGDP